MNNLFKCITIDSEISHGEPCIRELRYPVEMILELLSSGMTTEEIVEDYSDLKKNDILAVLLYASKLTELKSTYKLDADLHKKIVDFLLCEGCDNIHILKLCLSNNTRHISGSRTNE